MRKHVFLAGLMAMFFAVTSNAQGIDIDPGQWDMTSSMAMAMTGMSIPPQTFTVSECITEEELSPDHFNMDEDNPCNISNVDIDGNTAKWSISCPSDGGNMEGQWEITSHGDSISGNGTMTANFGGREMDFNMTWEGKRTGDCKE